MAMLNPCHPGETLRDDLAAVGLTVTETAARLGCTRQALSRLLNGKAGIRQRGKRRTHGRNPLRRWKRRGGVAGGFHLTVMFQGLRVA